MLCTFRGLLPTPVPLLHWDARALAEGTPARGARSTIAQGAPVRQMLEAPTWMRVLAPRVLGPYTR
jgi:hypothetical protein